MKTETPVSLSILAGQVAAALPGSWSVKPISDDVQNGNQYLIRSDGLTLFFAGSKGGWAPRGKIKISLSRPRGKDGQYVDAWENNARVETPEIGVSETKSADAIAADISRRLLSEAERVCKLVKERIDLYESADRAQRETLEKVGQAAGLPDILRNHNDESKPCFSLYLTDPRQAPESYASLAKIEVRGGNSVHFVIDATSEQALALIAFMRSEAYPAS